MIENSIKINIQTYKIKLFCNRIVVLIRGEDPKPPSTGYSITTLGWAGITS